eukprot:scaffold17820_cov59-Isochrysis_galbana.AAC.1
MPKRATMEERASERWCHALAVSTGEFCFRPTRIVARNSPVLAFDRIDARAAHSATLPGCCTLALATREA